MYEFIISLAASLTAELIKRNLFKGNKKKFIKKLTGIIDKSIVEYSENYSVNYKGSEIPFYGSQAIIDELLKFSFFEELNIDKINKALRKNSNIIQPSIEELNNFIRIFDKNIKDCEELKGIEKKEKFIDKNFENYLKLDEILKILKKDRIEKKQVLKPLPKPPYYKPEDLIGRNETIKNISEQLKSKSNVTLVNGIGGIGKTTIALAYANTPALMKQYDQIAWITVFDNIIDDTINQLAGSVPGFTYNTAESTEYNFRQLLIFLHEIDGNNLLIIDNANNLQNLLNVKRNIETLRWKVIITSRTEPPGYNNIHVDILDKKDAKILFDCYYKRDYKDKLLDKLLKKIEYHTLLTELLAKAANENPELDLPKLCHILDKKDLSADELQIDIVTEHELDKKNRLKMIQLYKYINKIFDATVSKLSNEEKQYLRYFAVLPSQFIEFTDLLNYFQIIKKDKTRLGNTLNLLYRKGWLIREENTYKAHSLIQTIAREKLKPDTKNCEALIDTFKWKLYTEAGDNPLNKKEFVPYAENLLKTIKTENTEIATLSNNLADIFMNLGNYKKALEYNLKSIAIREKVLEPNHPSLATSYNNISGTYSD
jgi:predicted metal-dependent hydrolase